MKRRKFLKNASVAGGATAVAASTFPAPAISQGRIRWNAVSAFGKAGLLGQALEEFTRFVNTASESCLLYTSPSPRDRQKSRMPSSA